MCILGGRVDREGMTHLRSSRRKLFINPSDARRAVFKLSECLSICRSDMRNRNVRYACVQRHCCRTAGTCIAPSHLLAEKATNGGLYLYTTTERPCSHLFPVTPSERAHVHNTPKPCLCGPLAGAGMLNVQRLGRCDSLWTCWCSERRWKCDNYIELLCSDR